MCLHTPPSWFSLSAISISHLGMGKATRLNKQGTLSERPFISAILKSGRNWEEWTGRKTKNKMVQTKVS